MGRGVRTSHRYTEGLLPRKGRGRVPFSFQKPADGEEPVKNCQKNPGFFGENPKKKTLILHNFSDSRKKNPNLSIRKFNALMLFDQKYTIIFDEFFYELNFLEKKTQKMNCFHKKKRFFGNEFWKNFQN